MQDILASPYFNTWIFPILIFFARITDVTIGTVRIIMISKGFKFFAPILGFFEVLIWILVISKVMSDASTIYHYIAYAAGFATGNLVGMLIEEKVALGYVVLRIVTVKPATELIQNLNDSGFGTTHLDATGSRGKVNIIYVVIKRTMLQTVISKIKIYNPNAFYTIEDVRFVNHGVFPGNSGGKQGIFRRWRSGK